MYLLLLNVRGATSYDHLKTVSSCTYDSFREAAQALGLVDSSEEYRQALDDAKRCRSAHHMRTLFAHILIHCDIVNGRELWDELKEDMADDHKRRIGAQNDVHHSLALKDISNTLAHVGAKTSDYGLPLPGDFDKVDFNNKDYERELHYDPAREAMKARQHRDSMYPEQARAFDDIVDHVESEAPGFFFIDGPGGTGKTYLYEALLHYVRGKGEVALACAWSGIAATLPEGGRTCRTRVGPPGPLPRDDVAPTTKG